MATFAYQSARLERLFHKGLSAIKLNIVPPLQNVGNIDDWVGYITARWGDCQSAGEAIWQPNPRFLSFSNRFWPYARVNLNGYSKKVMPLST